MIIEQCNENQAVDVKNIINKMWPSKSLDEIIKSLNDSQEVIFIAKYGDVIIGFVHGIIRYDYIEGVSEYPALYIEGIFVEENYRNKNVASCLTQRLIEFGKMKNIKQIASECRESNIQSYNWHIKNKFDACQKIVHFIKDI